MSSQSSGDQPDDTENLARAVTLSSQTHVHHRSLANLTQGPTAYQGALSKSTLPRRMLTGGPSASPPAHPSQLPTILPTGIQIGISMDASKSLTTTASLVAVPPPAIVSVGMATPSIVQINATSSSSLLSQALPLTGNIRGASQHQNPAFQTHLPRGAATAASVLACPKSVMTAMPVLRHSAAAIHIPGTTPHVGHTLTAPRSQLIASNIRPTTPPQTHSPAPTVSLAGVATSETHRVGISVQASGASTSASSIHIKLQSPCTTAEPLTKQVLPQSAKQIHVAQNLSSVPKVLVSQAAVTPIIQHSLKAAAPKQNKAAVPAVVAASLSSTGISPLSIPSVTPVTAPSAATSIPIAKVPPVRQPTAPASLAGITRMSIPQDTGSSTASQQHTKQTLSLPQGQPLTPQTQPHPQGQTHPPHTQPHPQGQTTSFVPQAHRPANIALSHLPNPVTHTDIRQERPAGITQLPQYPMTLLSEYQQIMYHQLASQIRPNPTGLLPAAGPHGLSVSSAPTVKFSPVTVMGDPLRLQTLSVQTPFSSAALSSVSDSGVRSSTPNDSLSGISCAVSTASIPVPALSAIALATSSAVSIAPTLYSVTQGTPHPGSLTPQHSSVTSQGATTPVSQPNASPRPSILRKRTNEGNAPVKKPVCGLNTMPDTHSPRPDSRTDSAPQSNTSSPKTPATPAGESQSSTDTALSSEATTPTHNSLGDLKIKQEPLDAVENGFPTAGAIAASLSASLPNSVEASPRKKPRKQLLHANEELRDNSSTDEDVEKVEEIKEEVSNPVKNEMKDEYVDDEGVRWTIEKTKPSLSLLNFYNISWKPKNNHFNRYTDVKPKDERRPTVNELSNQRGVMQKASGWKLFHVAAQLDDLTELERTLNSKVLTLQSSLAPQPTSRHSLMEDDLGLLHELTQGNIQRSRLISDQLEEAKSNMFKVLDHKTKITEIINKHMSKRPIKKKERT
ncbi:histone deacetylase complex subunit SAP130-A-like isoform X2 [Pecten maximus]|uniref:histone deacetylase complex subunit SAP130-A-like isoform X2 n=1 Tax=Pecten maximus TaxID=6579 RepID=UPI0014584FF6|nr:histone deacetylase complex subunit SAP130-A-like isoform X2 [Pecten maximus]